MRVTVISIEAGVLGKILKVLVKEMEDLGIKGKMETI